MPDEVRRHEGENEGDDEVIEEFEASRADNDANHQFLIAG